MRECVIHDAMGQRIAKTVTNKNTTDGTDKFVTTYYVRDQQGNVLAVYEHKHGDSDNGTFTLAEQHLYGASRLGMKKRDLALNVANASEPTPATHYELTNHLGNVMAVISDEASTTDEPMVVSLSDYYPFGMSMPERTYSPDYRYGYTGHEKENDLAEGVYTTEYRLLDTRLGRWMSVDKLAGDYTWMSPYNYCDGNPVMMVDPDGKRIKKGLNKAASNLATNPKDIDTEINNYAEQNKPFSIIKDYLKNNDNYVITVHQVNENFPHAGTKGRVRGGDDKWQINVDLRLRFKTKTLVNWDKSWDNHTLFEEFFHCVQRMIYPSHEKVSTLQREVEVKYARLRFGQYNEVGGGAEDEVFRSLAEELKDQLKEPSKFSKEIAIKIAKKIIEPPKTKENPENNGFGYTDLQEQFNEKTFKPAYSVVNKIIGEYNKWLKEKKEEKKK